MAKMICELEDNGTLKSGLFVLRLRAGNLILVASLVCVCLAVLGLAPKQAERPPQPFFQDFFSGTVTVQGDPPGEGTSLVACIDSCAQDFESSPYPLNPDGTFAQLEVNPSDETLVGHLIHFYLVNDYGRITAIETRPYIGVFDFYVQDLTFVDPIPIKPLALPVPVVDPEPTPLPTVRVSLPVAGDPALADIPKIGLVAGMVAVIIGGGLLIRGGLRGSKR